MPELPDVAGFKRYLDATSLHQRIARTQCLDERFIKGVSRGSLQRRLKAARLEGSRRWGKWLFVELSSPGRLVLHFGMTGRLEYGAGEGRLPRHTRLALHFETGRRLAIISQRMLGRADWTDDVAEYARRHHVGPDALEGMSRRCFLRRLAGRRGRIKSVLMNQSVLAGIGNVYADEILFQAGVHPRALLDSLPPDTLRRLYRVTRRVLSRASRRAGEPGRLPRTWLIHTRRPGGRCPGCGGQLESEKVGSRTAYFCPRRQESPSPAERLGQPGDREHDDG